MSEPAIVVEGLVKRYGKVVALDGIDLEVPPATVLGLLGPNGAGKTTAVRILTTLLRPDAGKATVAGFDVVRQAEELRHVIGLAGQNAAVDENLTGLENLEMVGRLYHVPAAEARRRGEELLERFELTAAANRTAKTYSGGMRRRLDLGASLVGNPRMMFLDEPTTGLDPRSRQVMWEMIRGLVAEGVTVLLSTQYLEEADDLSDRIAVIDLGTVIAEGTSGELKDKIGGEVLALPGRGPANVPRGGRRRAGPRAAAAATVDNNTGDVTIPVGAGGTASPDRGGPSARCPGDHGSRTSGCAGRRSTTSSWR